MTVNTATTTNKHPEETLPNYSTRPGIGLALGGGAARGMAHLGLLRALESHKIPIACICGTSMGAVVGVAYALSPAAEHIIRDFRSYIYSTHFTKARYAFMRQYGKKQNPNQGLRHKLNQSYLLGRSLATGAVIDFESFCSEIFALVPNKNFSNCKIPFACTAVDLFSFQEVLFVRGNLRPAVLASSAIPGVFPAVRSNQALYVDGGWMNKIPVSPLRYLGVEQVIGIDVTDRPTPDINPRRGYSIITQTHRAAQVRLQELQTERAQLMWSPPVEHIHWADFTRIDDAVEAGYQFGNDNIDAVHAILDPPKQSWLKRLRNRLLACEMQPLPPATFSPRAIWKAAPAEED